MLVVTSDVPLNKFLGVENRLVARGIDALRVFIPEGVSNPVPSLFPLAIGTIAWDGMGGLLPSGSLATREVGVSGELTLSCFCGDPSFGFFLDPFFPER
jgi:hypothetical protein